jgi:serine/threonine protein kinase
MARSPAHAGPESTEIFGPFEVTQRLGIGGMATVHRAVERGIEGFERVVALKRLLPHLAEDEAFVRAFVREAKLASLLQHGSIVQLYELGRVDGSYFIAMEYVRGCDLRRILRQAKRVMGPPPVSVAMALVGELLDALDYAHTRTDDDGTPLGLVHRDISPSNLLVSHDGYLKVIDFGIAKATLGPLATHTGRIKGKLSYLAPEALAGRGLDNRSDLFSASIIAHELLCAHPLFAADNDFRTIERVQYMEPPAPSTKNPKVPPALDALVLRGLTKDPSERWHSASQMRAELADVVVRHRLHCTNREVAAWVAEAFAERRRGPLAETTLNTTTVLPASNGVEEAADREAPTGVDHAPVDPDLASGSSALFFRPPTSDVVEARVTFRKPSRPPPAGLGDLVAGMPEVLGPRPGSETAPHRHPRGKELPGPAEWADGSALSSPPTPEPHEEEAPTLRDASAVKGTPARRRALAQGEPLARDLPLALGEGILARHKPSRGPLVLTLLVALAGLGAILYLAS